MKNLLRSLVIGVTLLVSLALMQPGGTRQGMMQMLITGNSAPSDLDITRSATITNFPLSTTLTARNASGVQLSVKPSSWIVTSAPSSGTVGSASIAAEAGVRHVADCVAFSADSGGAVTAAAGTFVIRDGATGAGTVVWNYAVAHAVAAAAGVDTILPVNFCGLNIVGTTNTAMTAEFNSGVTGEVQVANLSGFNIQ